MGKNNGTLSFAALKLMICLKSTFKLKHNPALGRKVSPSAPTRGSSVWFVLASLHEVAFSFDYQVNFGLFGVKLI